MTIFAVKFLGEGVTGEKIQPICKVIIKVKYVLPIFHVPMQIWEDWVVYSLIVVPK